MVRSDSLMTLPEHDFSPTPEPVAFIPDPRAELTRAAEVIVIGGGMLGASAAGAEVRLSRAAVATSRRPG